MTHVEHAPAEHAPVLAGRADGTGSTRGGCCRGKPAVVSWRTSAVMLALTVLSGCVSVRYQRPGRQIAPRAGETLVFGRVRCFHDGREFFPWSVSLTAPLGGTNAERHLWLLRLGRRAVSAEVHPDPDGSLAIWLASGDYALIGSMQLPTSGAPYEVVSLLRVPAGPVSAYTGELNLKTESHEGGHLSYTELGETSVTLLPIDIARVTLEQRLGPLDGSRPSLGPDQADTNNPARIAIYGVGDTIIGHLIVGSSTPEDARRVLAAQGGLGPARDNDVTFRIGSATMRPRLLYTPPGTMHQLYFDKDRLVLVVAGVPRGLPATLPEFMGRFPHARETHRESGWYELQTPLSECIWLIAVFDARTDRLESNGYACTCRAA